MRKAAQTNISNRIPAYPPSSTPLISVVLPVYNRAAYIKRSIVSILKQTYQNLEVIVVDDGSSDRTREEVTQLSDPRVRLIALSSNRGANIARNVGIKAAIGDWVAFQDSDDEWHPEKLEKQIAACLDQQTSVVFCGMNRHVGENVQYIPKPKHKIQPSNSNRLHEVLSVSFISNVTLLVHRQVFSAVGGYDEGLQRLQDWELSIRIAEIFPITYVSEALVDAYVMPDSITNQNGICLAINHILNKHSRLFESDRVAMGTQLLNLSFHTLTDDQYSKALKHVLFAIKKCKFQIFLAAYHMAKRR